MRSLAVVLLFGLVITGCSGCDEDPDNNKPDAGMDLPDAGPGETVCEQLAPVASGTCEVTKGSETRLLKGNILTPETVFVGGQVTVDAGGTITCVGCNCETGGETVISCPNASVSPGLINPHDHITFTQNDPYTVGRNARYDHRHEWRKGAGTDKPKIPAPGGASGVRISWGELRFVMGGGTSIVGSGGAAGLLRNLDDATKQEGLNHKAVEFETFPLGDSGGTRRTADCNYGTIVTPESLANFDSFEPHTSEGVDLSANNEFKCQSSDTYDTMTPGLSENLLLPKTAMIHAIGLKAADYGAMAAAGTALIWSPRSNVTLYGDTARVTLAQALGVEIAIGTDWMPTGSMNMLRELRCAADLNETYFDNYFTDKQLWQMVTINAAAVTATDDAIGLLAPNHVADIAIFAGQTGKNGYRAVIDAEPKDVALVMRGGTVLFGDDTTVAGLTTSCDTLDVCGQQKRVCTKREVGKTYDELVTAVGDIYPAFACGVPDNEPSCVPSRPAANMGSTIFTGMPTATDSDGDGIPDATDNCPNVFNPVRPMDASMQPDLDADGSGDACDVCPNDPNLTTCSMINPDDRDRDGVLNTADNCPDISNPAQSDGDGDDKGDACDACPSDANPGTAGCPVSIYSIKTGTTPVSTKVRVENALVTGKGSNGFFVQVKSGDPGYNGPDNSGLFIYTGPMSVQLANAVVGLRVNIDGTVANFQGQLELDTVSSVTATTMSVELAPAPITVTYAEVKTGGSKATTLESVLVTVNGAASATAVDAMYGEYTLTSGADTLVVDDFLYVTPGAAVGMQVTSITGVLAFRQMASKLEPRNAQDISQGAPTLAAFGPALSYVRVGQNNVNTFPVGSELTVTLSGPAQGDTIVNLSATNAIQIPMNRVTVLSGQTTATVVLSGQTQNAGVTITAQLGSGTPLTAVVRVLGATEAPTTVTLSPANATVAPNGMVSLTATLDIPAPPGGTPITLSVNPAGSGTFTAATVAANTMSAAFTYTDTTGSGMATVTGAISGSNDTCEITVAGGGGTNLVINEIDYDQALTDQAEYIEIYNPTGAAISLANVAVVLINGAPTVLAAYPDPDSIIDLSSLGSLPAGGYLVIAGSNIAVPSGALKFDPGWTSDQIQNGAPDGVALVDTSTNTLIDALSYEGSIIAAEVPGIAAPVSLVEGTALSTAITDSNTVAGSLCRSPNGQDTNQANTDWKFCSTLTPGAANP